MPIMVYICLDCTTKVERLRFKRENVGKNPYCHECNKRMIRVIHPANLRFEGGGWTVNKPKEED
jgi:predicted nucleic acid-binding Zn ribbon protein